MIRVLLLSPLPGFDPPNGDVTYTLSLLDNPPPNIQYVTYSDALASGDLRELGRRESPSHRGPSVLSPTVLREGLVNRVRRREIIFREPFRYFGVRPDAFDLIHFHAFSVRLGGAERIPLVASNSAASEWLYADAEHWSPGHTRMARAIDRALAAATDVQHIAYRLPRVKRIISWSEYLRDWYVAERVAPIHKIDVIPPFVAIPTQPRRLTHTANRLLFVGDFDIKGGDTALAAYDLVRSQRPDARLKIVGSEPRITAHEARERGIEWTPRIPRELLVHHVMQEADVLLYPTRFDGLPLTLLEAMSQGLPAAASNYRAIPEVLAHGKAGLLSDLEDHIGLAENVLRLLRAETNHRFSQAARHQVERHYSGDVVRRKLATTYEHALSG